ncbi:MAG TPA: SDR family NAD(P)-dependent oxidoreductase [Pseudorhodoplanes sp.]|jgi:NAD(P)-dependent dehydrogenase (short-subunit alcohol dehydrogenase family)|nr:SDR family NAD(P)-dependent oxidoreductase [Pseudorhodoplanes sp.]
MDFTDRHVIVTGGTGALGTAVVGALIAAGAHCHVPFRDNAEADRFIHRNHRNVTLMQGGDLSVEESVSSIYRAVPSLFASIHLAGGFAPGKVAETGKAGLMAQIETNLVSAFLCCRAAVNAMRDGGRIVNVAARPGLEWRNGAGLAAYATAKAGVAALTVALSEEVAKDGILVNAVAPSIMDTPANRRAMPKADFDAWPKVEDVAATIVFLASAANRVTRGAVVPVYGRF